MTQHNSWAKTPYPQHLDLRANYPAQFMGRSARRTNHLAQFIVDARPLLENSQPSFLPLPVDFERITSHNSTLPKDHLAMNPNPYHFLTLLSRLLDREGSVLLTRTVDPDKSTSTDRIELGIPADELHGMGLATIAHVHDTHQLAMARGTESQALDIARMIAKLEEGTDPANEPPQPEQVAEAVEPNDPEDPFEDGTIVPGTTYGEDPGTDIDHDHDDEIEPPTDDGLHTDTGVEDSNQSEGC